MLSDPDLSKIRRYLQFVADSASKKGKGNVYFFEMSQQSGSYAIDYHPTLAQHRKNALELTDYIKSIKGWSIVPVFWKASIVDSKHIKVEYNVTLQDKTGNFAGFSVSANNNKLAIGEISVDASNDKLLNITLNQAINAGDNIVLNYEPGTVESVDGIKIQAISNLSLTNWIVATCIEKGSVNSKGTKVTLTCNKNLKTVTSIDGVVLKDNSGVLTIDSFFIGNALLVLYVKEVINQGDVVYASYKGTSLYSVDEVPVSNFTDLQVKNGSTITDLTLNADADFAIYPNPNYTGVFNYTVNDNFFTQNTVVEVIDSKGAVVFRQNLVNHQGQFSINQKIGKGIYVFKISNGNSLVSKSVIIG
jgi:hypothetical protein